MVYCYACNRNWHLLCFACTIDENNYKTCSHQELQKHFGKRLHQVVYYDWGATASALKKCVDLQEFEGPGHLHCRMMQTLHPGVYFHTGTACKTFIKLFRCTMHLSKGHVYRLFKGLPCRWPAFGYAQWINEIGHRCAMELTDGCAIWNTTDGKFVLFKQHSKGKVLSCQDILHYHSLSKNPLFFKADEETKSWQWMSLVHYQTVIANRQGMFLSVRPCYPDERI